LTHFSICRNFHVPDSSQHDKSQRDDFSSSEPTGSNCSEVNQKTSGSESDDSKSKKRKTRSLLNPVPCRKKEKSGIDGTISALSTSVCLFCDEPMFLKNHLWLKHEIQKENISPTKEVYTCKRCEMSFSLKDAINHWKETHKECPVILCSSNFKTDEELIHHKDSVHNGRTVKVKYRRKVRQKGIKCKFCPMRLLSKFGMLNHLKTDHKTEAPQQTLPCSHCDLIFQDTIHLKRHKLGVHQFGSKEQGHYQCGFCLKYFSDISYHKSHVKIVHYKGFKPSTTGQLPDNIKCFNCVGCPYYSTEEELKAHEDTEEHKNEINSRISVFCNVCKKNFKGSLEALKDHIESEDHQNELESLGNFERETFCIPCRVPFESFQDLCKHEGRSLDHKNICKEFRENQLEENMKGKSSLICHACHNVFDCRIELEKHIKKFHPLNGHFCKVK